MSDRFLQEDTIRLDGAAGLVPAPYLVCSVPHLHLTSIFPSYCSLTSFLLPQNSRLWCLTAFMERCWDVLPAWITGWSLPRGAAPGSSDTGTKAERAGDSPEIFTFNLFASFPSKSADIWKRGIVAICLFQQVPPLPVLLPALPGCQRPQHRGRHWL